MAKRNPLIPIKPKSTTWNNPRKSGGILDDYAQRKNIATQEGTIEKVPVNDSDIVNKKYVDDQFPVTHASTTGQTTDDHHPQSHNIASHSDTTATGAELETLTDNSMADTLHRHSELSASDGTPDQALVVDASGNVGIGTTSPAKDLDVSGEIRASTGILFGTDTAAANTLDDYEEGSFTGTFRLDSTAQATGTGYYTKVGRVVHFHINSAEISESGTGSLNMIGLPFTSSATSGEVTGSWNGDKITWSSGDLVWTLAANDNALAVGYHSDAGSNFGQLTETGIENNSTINISGHYFV